MRRAETLRLACSMRAEIEALQKAIDDEIAAKSKGS